MIQIVPVGGFKILSNLEMRRNDLCNGLSSEEIGQLEKYLHFQLVHCQDRKVLIAMGKAIFDFAFLVLWCLYSIWN